MSRTGTIALTIRSALVARLHWQRALVRMQRGVDLAHLRFAGPDTPIGALEFNGSRSSGAGPRRSGEGSVAGRRFSRKAQVP
jgi:hypothetical protein